MSSMRWFLVLGVVVACGDDTVQPPQPDAPDIVPPAKLPDLRFKWVGAFDRYEPDLLSNLLTGTTQTLEGERTFSPFEVGGGSWNKYRFTPSVAIDPLTTFAEASEVGVPSERLTELKDGHVVMSLDFAPGSYAVIAARVAGIAGIYGQGPLANLLANVPTQAAQGTLFTAVAFDGTTGHIIGGKVPGDTTTYEAQAVMTDLAMLATDAVALGNAGYVITAFGRASDTTYALIGSRVAGSTAPRETVLSELGDDEVVSRLQSGFAIVGMAFTPGARPVILQR